MKQRIHDAATGEYEDIELDEQWVLENIPKRVVLDVNKTDILADGQDTAIIRGKLVNGLDKQSKMRYTAIMNVDGETVSVDSDANGKFQLPFAAVEPGEYTIFCAQPPSKNILLIMAGE